MINLNKYEQFKRAQVKFFKNGRMKYITEEEWQEFEVLFRSIIE